MGRYFLRRKVLNEKKYLLTFVLTFLFFLSFLVLNPILAYSDENRPLRTVSQENSFRPSSVNSSFAINNSTLLTTYALEQPLTQRYITQYTSRTGIAYLNAAMERASLYLPFIREEIARQNLPPELAFLPVITRQFPPLYSISNTLFPFYYTFSIYHYI